MARNLHTHAEEIINTRDVEKIKDASMELAEDIAGDIKELGNAVRDLASDSVKKVQNKASKLYSKGQIQVRNAEHRLEQKIRAKPMQALLIAAGVGFLIGWLRKKA